jgi:hypothetical protein
LHGGKVRAADVADLALANQVVERPQRVLDRDRRIGMVLLIGSIQSVCSRRRLASTAVMM